MQAVIGGAYNGKRKYVMETLQNKGAKSIFTYEGEIPEGNFTKNDYVVIGNFEKLILHNLSLDEEKIAFEVMNKLEKLDEQTNVICICTDIGRGIVPLSKEERKLRDTCGRLYQQLFLRCDKVIRVWYGIPEVLKGGDFE